MPSHQDRRDPLPKDYQFPVKPSPVTSCPSCGTEGTKGDLCLACVVNPHPPSVVVGA